jgi:tRNA (guanine37-N1)-methyltransferase
VPSGKKNVFVWANDLNPDSYEGLSWAIKRNKVDQFVHASCSDGRAFIRSATKRLPTAKRRAVLKSKKSRAVTKVETMQAARILEEPATFDHYVMNLPASAVEFLDAFRSVYAGREREFQPHTERKLPMVHVYCFVRTMETETEENHAVCELVSRHLGHPITCASSDVEIWYVRLVSPKKKMFCASFRLPPEVALALAEHDNQAA